MTRLARSPRDIGNLLRQARKSRALSQQQLADYSGLRQETISRLENGSPGARLETLFDLCAALELELLLTERSKGDHDYLNDTL